MKRSLVSILLSVVLCASLIGCGWKEEPVVYDKDFSKETEATDEDDADVNETASATQEATEEASEVENNIAPTPVQNEYIDVQTEDDMKDLLVGTWMFFDPPVDGAVIEYCVDIKFNEDGTFEGYRGVSSTTTYYNFKGTWELERLYRLDEELPDCLDLHFDFCETPEYDGKENFQTFEFDHFSILGDYLGMQYVMGLRKVSPIDYVFGNNKDVVMYKAGVVDVDDKDIGPDPGYTINGNLWKVEHTEDATIFWISDANDGHLETMRKAYGYEDDYSEEPFDSFDDGYFYPVVYVTNECGDVNSIARRITSLEQSDENFMASLQEK